ncbi:MAG TPA: O-antigen ligase family protein [Candidatus Paceibacterota bacterium]
MNKDTLKWVIFGGLFTIPFIPFLVSSSLFFPFITTKAFVWRVIVEVIFAFWLILMLKEPEYRPKRSPILYAVLSFILIIGIADLLGDSPLKSFWSNFERMEGFISFLHLGAFFLVVGSVFKEEHWKNWWNTSLIASFLMALHALTQSGRVEGTFGNPIYLSVYMLFHVFIALFYLMREKEAGWRYFYGVLIVFETFILYRTATRGAILGILGGFVILALLNIRKRASQGLLLGLLLLVGGFFLVRDTNFVKTSPVLSRFSSLSFEEIKTQGRYFVWPIAMKGFKEKPILGWGQENFHEVFQKHYVPEMYNLEPWFDRAHNIFLDYLVVAGIVGLLAYLSLYGALLYLLYHDEKLSYTEKSVIVSLLAAYFFHNFFVFDHLISYVLFFSLLAFIHSRHSGVPLTEKRLTEKYLNVSAALTSLCLVSSLYFVNWKPLTGNLAIIEAFRALQTGNVNKVTTSFERAYLASPLGKQEVTEQMVIHAVPVLSAENIPVEDRNKLFKFIRDAVLETASKFPNDARTQLITGAFLTATADPSEGLKYLIRAHELSPNKQQMYWELANAYFVKGDKEKAIEVLTELGKKSLPHKMQADEYIKQIKNS